MARSINVPVYVTLAVDPALTASKTADFTGITVVGTDIEGRWYVMEADNFKGVPHEVIDRIVRYTQLYKPVVLSIETVAAQILYRPLLVPALYEAGVEPRIYEYHAPPYRSKSQRIEALQPKFKGGMIYIREGLEDLIEQLDRYPEVEHDDLLDSLAQHLEIARPPRKGEAHPSIGRDWFERFARYKDLAYDPQKDLGLPQDKRFLDGTTTGRHATLTRPPR